MPQHALRQMLAALSEQVKTPLLYVPSGKVGLLLALESGADDAAKAQRREATARLGFEEADGTPGVARMLPPTDKDMMLLIDTSGSMSGRRIRGATDNALRIYDDFTDEHDHIGLIHFHVHSKIKMKLQPCKGKARNAQRDAIDQTRKPEW